MPNNNAGNPIYVLGQEYILEFSDLLAKTIEQFLKQKWGDNWFQECAITEPNSSKEMHFDLSFLLKQLLDFNNHNYRMAIAYPFFKSNQLQKPHLTALEQIRKSRNLWAHPSRVLNLKDLTKLSFNIIAVIPQDSPLAIKCSNSLSVSPNIGHHSLIASMTEISQIYKNTSEYKSEMAKLLKELNSQIEKYSTHPEFDSLFIAQNHLLNNLYLNFQIIQNLYHAMMLDNLIDLRDPKDGRKMLSDNALEELYRDLDTDQAMKIAAEFGESLKSEIGRDKCFCDFCKSIPNSGGFSMSEAGQEKVNEVYLRLHTGKDISDIFHGETAGKGRLPHVFLMMMAFMHNMSGISAEEIMNWNFDILNPRIDLDSDVYDINGLTNAVMKLLAIRNGVPPDEVEKWNFE